MGWKEKGMFRKRRVLVLYLALILLCSFVSSANKAP